MDESENIKFDAARERCVNFLADMVLKYSHIIQPITKEDIIELFSANKKPA